MKLTGNPSDQPCNEICTKRTNLKSVQKPSYYGVSFASQKGFFGNTRREKYQLWSERDSMTPVVEFGKTKVICFRFLIVILYSGSILSIKTRTADSQWSLFSLKSRTFGLGQTNWTHKLWGIWGIFGLTTILVQWVPWRCFTLFNNYFCKKLSLDIHIPNIYLWLGFRFGPQRIRDSAFMCP